MNRHHAQRWSRLLAVKFDHAARTSKASKPIELLVILGRLFTVDVGLAAISTVAFPRGEWRQYVLQRRTSSHVLDLRSLAASTPREAVLQPLWMDSVQVGAWVVGAAVDQVLVLVAHLKATTILEGIGGQSANGGTFGCHTGWQSDSSQHSNRQQLEGVHGGGGNGALFKRYLSSKMTGLFLTRSSISNK